MSSIRGVLAVMLVVSASSCSILGESSNDTLAPLLTAPPTTTASTAVTESSAATIETSTTVNMEPTTSSTSSPTTAVTGQFPTAVPTGKCTPQGIREDFGTAPEAWLECAGAWAVTRIENCPPEVECEGVDIFRWTNDGWRHRGMTYSLCVLMVDETGMPRSVNDQLLGGNTDCVEPITYTNESSSETLQVGSKGDRTRQLQRRLVQLKLLNDSADGYFGANTRNAVFDFQHLAGLQPTGVVDEVTARALGLPWP